MPDFSELACRMAVLSELLNDAKETFTPDDYQALAEMLLLTQKNVQIIEEFALNELDDKERN